MISALLYKLNHAPLWRSEIDVWDRRMRAASLDRFVALGLHRLGWMGRSESVLLRRLVRPGMHVVDVGANIGLYSLLLARLVDQGGSVLAFEPEPSLFATLRENCVINGVTNVLSFQCALGQMKGTALLHCSAFNSGDNRLGHPSIGLDDLLPESKPDFIKIDVQGHELAALTGMEHALAASPNVHILFEFSPTALRDAGTAPDRLLDFFHDHGFELYETGDARLKKLRNSRQLITDLGGRGYTNLLAKRGALEVDD